MDHKKTKQTNKQNNIVCHIDKNRKTHERVFFFIKQFKKSIKKTNNKFKYISYKTKTYTDYTAHKHDGTWNSPVIKL